MAAKDLITSARAAQGIQAYPIVPDPTGVLAVLVTSISDAIEKYCRRRFIKQSYDEQYNGDGDRRLLLRQYPIQSVQSVRYRPVTVLKVTNTDATNVQARVSVTSVGLKLFRSNAGVGSTDTSCTFAGNPTLTQLAAAVNALGHGWSAQVVGDSTNYGGWPSADLYVPNSYGDALEGSGVLESQGAQSTVVGSGNSSFAELKMHTFELQGYQWDARGWLLRAIPYTDPELMNPEDLVWPVGINNFRIQYTAGYSTIPEAVQEACAEWVSMTYYATQRDPAIANLLTAAGVSTAWAKLTGSVPGYPPDNIRALLAPYRRHVAAHNQG